MNTPLMEKFFSEVYFILNSLNARGVDTDKADLQMLMGAAIYRSILCDLDSKTFIDSYKLDGIKIHGIPIERIPELQMDDVVFMVNRKRYCAFKIET